MKLLRLGAAVGLVLGLCGAVSPPVSAQSMNIFNGSNQIHTSHGAAYNDNVMSTMANYVSGSSCVGNVNDPSGTLWAVDCSGGAAHWTSQSASALRTRFCYGILWGGVWTQGSCSSSYTDQHEFILDNYSTNWNHYW